jgi:hypothetical protein
LIVFTLPQVDPGNEPLPEVVLSHEPTFVLLYILIGRRERHPRWRL